MLKNLAQDREEWQDSKEHRAMWLLGAAFTEFVRNPSTLHWQALEEAMSQYQRINKDSQAQ